MNSQYRICTRCVMDTTDPQISFDLSGECTHCRNYDRRVSQLVKTGDEGRIYLEGLVAKIKHEGLKRKYDCIIGLSGGVDSSFVAYKVKQMGLRPLAVHLDNGWNSELAVKNIENIVKRLNIDLYTHVIDWDIYRRIQLSFLYASTPDSEIPSDHAIVSIMRKMASKYGVKYVINGCNIRTESHHATAWSQGHLDWKYIRSVCHIFGIKNFKTYPHRGRLEDAYYKFTQKWVNILDYVDYRKDEAKETITRELGWRDYGGKHMESIYTRFFQGYLLPRKFGFDKRKMHLSSLICSGEVSRDEALEMLKKPTYPTDIQDRDRSYVIKKLNIDENEFDKIMSTPPKTYWDYPSYNRFRRSRWFLLMRKWIKGY